MTLQQMTDHRLQVAYAHARMWQEHWRSQLVSIFHAGQAAGYTQLLNAIRAEQNRRDKT